MGQENHLYKLRNIANISNFITWPDVFNNSPLEMIIMCLILTYVNGNIGRNWSNYVSHLLLVYIAKIGVFQNITYAKYFLTA